MQIEKSFDQINNLSVENNYPVNLHNVDQNFEPWLTKARERIFSLAAGDRIANLSPRIMEIGFGKVLYAADQLGSDIPQANPYVLFAPDGTCSYNPVRTQRGFSYGGIIEMEFDGLLATNNSMPNGCGFSIYELIDPPSDNLVLNYLTDAQSRLGQDKLSQLGKGNHFAGLYYVLDPLSGEDTGRRFVVIHCSGHVGGHKLYHPHSWLNDVDGYHEIQTPHGSITLMESEAKSRYLNQYRETDQANATNRDLTMQEIFADMEWKRLEEITHQGLFEDGKKHVIGCQVHDGLMPIAFNPEEGLVLVNTNDNLSREFINRWEHGERIKNLGLEKKFMSLNITPHGAGYEFRYPLRSAEIHLSKEGIQKFSVTLVNDLTMEFEYFREIREWMTYRRKAPVLREVFNADLAKIEYELPSMMQIYPLVSIPGGSH